MESPAEPGKPGTDGKEVEPEAAGRTEGEGRVWDQWPGADRREDKTGGEQREDTADTEPGGTQPAGGPAGSPATLVPEPSWAAAASPCGCKCGCESLCACARVYMHACGGAEVWPRYVVGVGSTRSELTGCELSIVVCMNVGMSVAVHM